MSGQPNPANPIPSGTVPPAGVSGQPPTPPPTGKKTPAPTAASRLGQCLRAIGELKTAIVAHGERLAALEKTRGQMAILTDVLTARPAATVNPPTPAATGSTPPPPTPSIPQTVADRSTDKSDDRFTKTCLVVIAALILVIIFQLLFITATGRAVGQPAGPQATISSPATVTPTAPETKTAPEVKATPPADRAPAPTPPPAASPPPTRPPITAHITYGKSGSEEPAVETAEGEVAKEVRITVPGDTKTLTVKIK